ncbi:hypothetical protein SAMD00019534_113580 [Acytostelium subglobosum LB1]|uniref:hypothetical protein n=1 Tax=Acytostelium subglobosum LB1 TaxID=1410327 RepID=UPI000644A49D|nr:hypothetical protein SAMD00019534_113580 [Acytostelium subglobosum LB1]GAM28182.1 hypothetical protein SAMD00019534_113580 [Acytostelium subglobosum LB1]|eukprot:XP_012748816.1 hypothetical protein SAMD00019534_113580 [Acytostelium subglobosum LB1]
MRLAKVDNVNNITQLKKPLVSSSMTASKSATTTTQSSTAVNNNNKVPKKPSPIKNAVRKSTSNNNNIDTTTIFFKDIESLKKDGNAQKGKEVKSLASYYENLNSSSNKIAIAKKKSIIPTTKPTTTTTSTTTTTKSTATVVPTATTKKIETTQPTQVQTQTQRPATPQPPSRLNESSGVPEVIEVMRETVDIYRNKIVELEKRLEAEAAATRSLKQEMLLMNEQHTYEVERLHHAVDIKDDEMAKLREQMETNNYSMLDVDQLTENLDEKNERTQELEQELLEADELCYELRREKQNNLELIGQYRTELLDCQTLVAYYQDELGKKSAENNELHRKTQQQAEEIKAYKHKIQSFLELLETQQDLKQQQQQVQQVQQAKTPSKKENSSTLSNKVHTPVSATKKKKSASSSTSLSSSQLIGSGSVNSSLSSSMSERSIHVFKSPMSRAKTPKKVISSPRSMVDYI